MLTLDQHWRLEARSGTEARPSSTGLLFLLAQACELRGRVGFHVDFRMRLENGPVRTDQISNAFRVPIRFRLPGAIRDSNRPIDISEQRKGKAVLRSEGFLFVNRIETASENLGAQALIVTVEVPEPGTLDRSARCVGLRIKPENYVSARVVTQLDAAILVIGNLKSRRDVSNVQHEASSSAQNIRTGAPLLGLGVPARLSTASAPSQSHR